MANGTNRVAILLQNTVAVSSFHRRSRLDWRGGLALAALVALGALLGARIAVARGAAFVRSVLLGVLLLSAAKLLGAFGTIGDFLGLS